MAADYEFQSQFGTALATFGQNGTYSDWVQLNGRLVALYSDAFPAGAAGSITFRAAWGASGTGHAVQTNDGTALRVLAFGSGTYYTFGEPRWPTGGMQHVRLQVGTAGTATAAGGGTIVLITEA